MIDDNELREIYANAPVIKNTFEVVTFKSSWFEYHLQNTFAENVDVEFEQGIVVTAQYAPMRLSQSNSNVDMNYERSIVIEMVNDEIASQISQRDPASNELPTVESRFFIAYRDGTISSLKSPVVKTQVKSVRRNSQGAEITTTSKPVNQNKTGEVCTLKRAPGLRAYL